MATWCETERAIPLPPARRPRIFVDCTQTVSRPVTTGIPRVVRNLVRHGWMAAAARGAELVPVRFHGGRFVPLIARGLPPAALVDPPPERLFARRLRKILVPRTLVRKLGAFSARFRPAPTAAAGPGLAAGDVLLLPDSSWGEDMWPAVDMARAAGAALGVVQHDFIPIRHPRIVPPKTTVLFQRWMRATLARADFVLAVSETVARETRAELLKLGRAEIAKRHVTTFRNGADFAADSSGTARGPETVRRALRDFLAAGAEAPYLAVGTIEPRKNQALLLAALDRVLARAPAARLLIVGMVGWQGKPIAADFRRHPAWGSGLMHFEDLSDAELQYAYSRARALVFPSRAEGYGLPLVEAMACGLRVFASDIPVHREVGGGHCVYFDPERPDDLAGRLVALSRDGVYAACWPPRRCQLPTWAAAAERIVATALAHARPPADWAWAEPLERRAG